MHSLLQFPYELPLLSLLWLWLWLRLPGRAYALFGTTVFLGLCLLGLRFAVLHMGMNFMFYDDEGYVLYSLKNHLAGGALYDEVFSQYGPTFYLFWKVLNGVGVPVTHEAGRLVTSLIWLALAGGAARLCWKVGNSLIGSAFCFCLALFAFKVACDEPSHPVCLISLLFLIATFLFPQNQAGQNTRLVLLGTITAFLLLLKLYLGLVLIAALGVWWLHTRCVLGRVHRLLYLGGACLLVLMPSVLMRSFFATPGIPLFNFTLTASLLACLLAAPRGEAEQGQSGRFLILSALGLTLGIVTLLAYLLATQSTISGLLDGLIYTPLRRLGVFCIPPPFVLAALPFALVAWGTGLLSKTKYRSTAQHLSGLLCLIALGAVCAASLDLLNGLRVETVFCCLVLPAATSTVFNWDAEGTDKTASLRLWLLLIGLVQVLHAFPVSGSQLSLSFGPMLALVCARAFHWLGAPSFATESPRVKPLSYALTLVLGVSILWIPTTRLVEALPLREPLRLRGAEHLRLQAGVASRLQILCTNAEAHASMLFSQPGQFSFNLWSGVETPTQKNLTSWFVIPFFPDEARAEILLKLKAARDPIIIQEQINKDFLKNDYPCAPSPLERFIDETFVPLFVVDSYTFKVRKGSHALPLDLFRIFTRPGSDRVMIEFDHNFDRDSAPIAGVELRSLLVGDGTRKVSNFVPGRDGWEVCALSSEGTELSEYQRSSLPLVAKGLCRVRLYMPLPQPSPDPRSLLLKLTDGNQESVCLLRLLQRTN